jgi:hypothetical protein
VGCQIGEKEKKAGPGKKEKAQGGVRGFNFGEQNIGGRV